MSENTKRLVEVVAIILSGAFALFMVYHNLDGRVTSAEGRMSVVEARTTASEAKVEQESKGYLVIQAELAQRLDRLEGKLDLVIQQRGRR